MWPNRRSLMHALGVEFERLGVTRVPVCVLALDLDHFKQVNAPGVTPQATPCLGMLRQRSMGTRE